MKLTDLTVEQRQRLAPLAKTSDATLRNLQNGRRKASAEFAIRVEKGAKRMGLTLNREEVCAACKGCELAKAARKVAAT
jgi:hypothetical protein